MAQLLQPSRFAPKEAILAGSQLFAGISAPLVRAFAASSERLVLGRGDRVWTPGDPATHFSVVAYGTMKLQRLRPESPVILAFFNPGESVADALVVARGTMPACAVAQSSVVELLRVPAEPVLAAAKRDPALAEALHVAVSRQVRWLHTKIEVVTMGSVCERIATFVLRQVEQRALPQTRSEVELAFAPSRVELASMIEARPETVTRALGKLSRDGVLSVGKATIVVHDLRALRALVPHEVTGESASTATDATAVA